MGRGGGAFHAYARAPADCGETGLPEGPRQQKGPQRAQEGEEGLSEGKRLHPGRHPTPQGGFLFVLCFGLGAITGGGGTFGTHQLEHGRDCHLHGLAVKIVVRPVLNLLPYPLAALIHSPLGVEHVEIILRSVLGYLPCGTFGILAEAGQTVLSIY